MIKMHRHIVFLFFSLYAVPFFAGEYCAEACEGICKTVKEEIKNGTFTIPINGCNRKVLDAYLVYPQQIKDQSDYQKATALFTFLRNGTLRSTNESLWIADKPAFFQREKEMSKVSSACPGRVPGCAHTDASFKLVETTDQMLQKQQKGQKLEGLDIIDWEVEASVPSSKQCAIFPKTCGQSNPCPGVVRKEKHPLIKDLQGDILGWGIEEQYLKLATNNYFYTQKAVNRVQWFGTSANRFMIQASKVELEEPKLDKKRVSVVVGGTVAFLGALTGGLKLWSWYKNK